MKVISNLARVPEGEKGFKIRGTFNMGTAQHEPYVIFKVDKEEPVLGHLEVPPGPAGLRTLHFDTRNEAEDFLAKLGSTCRD